MSGFYCKCGHRTSTNVYPSKFEGDLKWQTESEFCSDEAYKLIEEYLNALQSGDDKTWLKKVFSPPYPFETITPIQVIQDLYSRAEGMKGRLIRQCENCQCIYIQEEYGSDKWTTYEKEEELDQPYSRNQFQRYLDD
jgi:hypothetical protein